MGGGYYLYMSKKADIDRLLKIAKKYDSIHHKFCELLPNHNIIGSYAEMLVCNVLSLKQMDNSNESFDAKEELTGHKYQIKARLRKGDSRKGQNEFGCIKENAFNENVFFVFVFFNRSLGNIEAYCIETKTLDKDDICFLFIKKKSGYIFRLTKERINHPRVMNISKQFEKYCFANKKNNKERINKYGEKQNF